MEIKGNYKWWLLSAAIILAITAIVIHHAYRKSGEFTHDNDSATTRRSDSGNDQSGDNLSQSETQDASQPASHVPFKIVYGDKLSDRLKQALQEVYEKPSNEMLMLNPESAVFWKALEDLKQSSDTSIIIDLGKGGISFKYIFGELPHLSLVDRNELPGVYAIDMSCWVKDEPVSRSWEKQNRFWLLNSLTLMSFYWAYESYCKLGVYASDTDFINCIFIWDETKTGKRFSIVGNASVNHPPEFYEKWQTNVKKKNIEVSVSYINKTIPLIDLRSVSPQSMFAMQALIDFFEEKMEIPSEAK